MVAGTFYICVGYKHTLVFCVEFLHGIFAGNFCMELLHGISTWKFSVILLSSDSTFLRCRYNFVSRSLKIGFKSTKIEKFVSGTGYYRN